MSLSSKAIPRDGLAGMAENWKSDLNAGFVVSLLALPLSLGIAIASGFPPIAGVFTAIIGGVVVAMFSGSQLTIKGPAAGLIAIAIGGIEELSALAQQTGQAASVGYQYILAVIVAASVIQILFGLLKAGNLGDFFPASVVHGMLAAIGIIILSKQIHVLLGVKPTAKEPLELLAEIPESMMHLNPLIAIIGVVCLVLLSILTFSRSKHLKIIPAPMIILLLVVPISVLFHLKDNYEYLINGHLYSINEKYFVSLPENLLSGLLANPYTAGIFIFPDFSQILNPISIKYILMFALVGSIESLLTVKAMDGFDPYHRKSNMNKDLLAVGIGNLLCGLIGSLPMISEVVRSSANISNQAKTRWSNFYHGLFLLLYVTLLSFVITYIPLTALAAMLVFTGYRLASPKEFINTYKVGKEQLLYFLTTLIVTLATDLLIGVFAGILVKVAVEVYLVGSLGVLLKGKLNVENNGNKIKVYFPQAAVFLNYLRVKKMLHELPQQKHLILDFSKTRLIDHTFIENVHHFMHDYYRNGGEVDLEGLEAHRPSSLHPLAVRRLKPYFEVVNESLMTSRALFLEEISQRTHMDFYNRLSYNTTNLIDFSFFQGKVIRHKEHRIVTKNENYNLEFADLLLLEGARHAAQDYKISVAILYSFDFHLPEFTLEKEGIFNKVFQKLVTQDIDFEQSPVFSNLYELLGEDEKAIRNFFQPNIIALFEKTQGYTVECKENKLLILKNKSLLSENEVVELLAVANNLAENIILNYQKQQLTK